MPSYHTYPESRKDQNALLGVLSLNAEVRRFGSRELVEIAELVKSLETRLLQGGRVRSEDFSAVVNFVRRHTRPTGGGAEVAARG